MPNDEQRVRMQTMRRLVEEFNVYRWAGRLLLDAGRLRERERLTGRLKQGEGQGPEPAQAQARQPAEGSAT